MTTPDRRGAGLLLTFDGLNILRRVFGAIPGEDTAEKAEGAVTSSLGTIKRLLKHHKPTHVLAAFDHGGETFRHRMYPAYHAGRGPMPEVLRPQLPILFEKINAIGVPTISVPDVEADDVIATVCTKYVSTGKGAAVASSTDKDLCQLIPLGVYVYDQFAKKFVSEDDLLKRFCVTSNLLGDCLSLMSDKVDGIPGVPSVGKVTAGEWLTKYGNLEGVLANAEHIKGARGEKLREHLDDVIMSRKLVTLKTDVKLDLTWNRLLYAPARA